MPQTNFYMGKLTIQFNNVEELIEVLNRIPGGTITIELERKEFCDVMRVLLRRTDLEVKLIVSLKPTSQQGESATLGDCKEIDDEKVYEVVKAIVESKIREGKPYFMMQEVYEAICGRTLMIYRSKEDHKIALRLRRIVKRLLPRIGKELNVKFEEGILTQYGERTGKFRIFKILPGSR